MAKQTFTTGQVLTAAQQNTLQTNDFNQTVSAKVASYVLAAADAGTRITMNNAAATTITVNTGLFAAGDTLQITNIGAGVCTITAGTATVSTAGVFTLAQNASGTLYFTSTGVSIWQGSISPGSGMTLLSTTAITAVSSISITSISQSFTDLIVVIQNAAINGAGDAIYMAVNGVTTNYASFVMIDGGSSSTVGPYMQICGSTPTSTSISSRVYIQRYTDTTATKLFQIGAAHIQNTTNAKMAVFGAGIQSATTAISSIQIRTGVSNFLAQGNIYIYGVS